MNAVLTFADTRTREFFRRSLEVLALGRRVAGELGQRVCVLLPGGDVPEGLPADEAASSLEAHGADEVLLLSAPGLDPHRADHLAQALAGAKEAESPRLVLLPLNTLCREAAAMAAAKTGSGLIADCAKLSVEDGRVVADCPSWGGRVLARITWSDAGTCGFATVAPGAAVVQEAPGDPGAARELSLALSLPGEVEVESRRAAPAEAGDLSEAEVVVAGGAGMGSVEGFGKVRELAAALGGRVGATRPPVLAHWADEDALIGQTGTSVKPKLLVCAGISGAVQFTAGIADAGHVVAVNRDPSAPIFQAADIGVVADAGTFVPLFTEEVKKAVLKDLAEGMQNAREAGGPSGGQGAAVRALREGRGWTQEDLAAATDQTPEFIRRVEQGETSPSVAFLLRLARALGVDPGAFLGAEARAKMADQRSRAFSARTKNYSYQTLTPEAETAHLRAFLVDIEPRQAHKPVAYKHEGEEFIFVLEGALELFLDKKAHVLHQGESKRFNSEIPHKLKSRSDATTRLLVVLYTP
ncbi:MAG: FAD-binding protein [Deltaproteobacteria bacterium]|nr:FAD-binding protein [Deltaproteobacteria bacterium]